MHVFLAGATGVIGRRLVPVLVERGHRVTAMTRRPDRAGRLREMGAEPVLADAFARGDVVAALLAAAPDAVVHQLTDLSDIDTAANARLRIHGTRNLVDAARIAGVERLVAQSIAWAYAPGDAPAGEDVPLDRDAALPRRATVQAVDALETAVGQLPGVVLRYGLLYGPGTWFAPGGRFTADAQAGRLPADDDVTSFLHVDDAAAAAADALEWPPGPVNVCDDEPATGRDWVPALCAEVGGPPPAPGPSAPRTPWARGADNAHARRELGWTPCHPTWRDGLVTDLARSAR